MDLGPRLTNPLPWGKSIVDLNAKLYMWQFFFISSTLRWKEALILTRSMSCGPFFWNHENIHQPIQPANKFHFSFDLCFRLDLT